MSPEYLGVHGSRKDRVGDRRADRPCETHGHLDHTVREPQGSWVGGSLFRKNHTETGRTIKNRLEKSDVPNGWCDLRVSETRQPKNQRHQHDPRPYHRTCMWQDLTKLVPPVPQNKVQGRQDNEREKTQRHADVVHLRAAKPPKEGGSDEKLNGE